MDFDGQRPAEVSELECRDTSFRYQVFECIEEPERQDSNVAVHRTNICLTVTMYCCISQMQEYPGVRLSLVTWLKSRYVKLPVGEHTVEVGT